MTKKHTEVGDIINIDLQSVGSFADALVKRKDEQDAPLIVGQFVSIIVDALDEKIYLGRVESFRPDYEPDLHLKKAMKQQSNHDVPLDKLYKTQTLYLNYRIRVLGICEDVNNKIKFHSNVRSMPSVTSLKVAIPSANFMERLFKSAVEDSEDGKLNSFEIGVMKYGTYPEYTEKFYGGKNTVPVQFNAANLLRKRTAIFGKSGYGKSNTVKTVLGMMATQFPNCGQLIFDTNGEYAMENDQNDGFMDIFHEAGIKGRTVLYSARKIHEAKKQKFGASSFKQLRFDIFENITASMEIVLAELGGKPTPMYLQAWVNEAQGVDDQKDLFAQVKNKGIVWGIWFKACKDAGMTPLNEMSSIATLQVKKSFLSEMVSLGSEDDDEDDSDDNSDGSDSKSFDTLDPDVKKKFLLELGIFETNGKYFTKKIDTMAKYAEWYIQDLRRKEKMKKDGDGTSEDSTTSSVKAYVSLSDNYRRLFQLKGFNIGQLSESEKKGAKSLSLGESVWQDLCDKKIVMIDLASVAGNVGKTLAEQIASNLLTKASALFADGEQQDRFRNFDILCFIEEAQNYLSSEQIKNGSGIYERLAKEGRKFHIGLVYVTQQPSAIDEKISSQTENIIAMHMSNSSDTNTLFRIKDKFDELTCKFLKDEAQKGLAYLYAEPHQPFVLPAQIHKFDKQLILDGLKKSRNK